MSSRDQLDEEARRQAEIERAAAEIFFGTDAGNHIAPARNDDEPTGNDVVNYRVVPRTLEPDGAVTPTATPAPYRTLRLVILPWAFVLGVGAIVLYLFSCGGSNATKSSLEQAIERKQGIQIQSLTLNDSGGKWKFGTVVTSDGRNLPIAAQSTYYRTSSSHRWFLGEVKSDFLAKLKSDLARSGIDIIEENLVQNERGISYKGMVKGPENVVIQVDEFCQIVGDVSIVSERDLTIPEEHRCAFAERVICKQLGKSVKVLGEFDDVATNEVRRPLAPDEPPGHVAEPKGMRFRAAARIEGGNVITIDMVFDQSHDTNTGHTRKDLPRVIWMAK